MNLPPIDETYFLANYRGKIRAATYNHTLERWSLIKEVGYSLLTNDEIIEWWPLPAAGTGNKIKEGE